MERITEVSDMEKSEPSRKPVRETWGRAKKNAVVDIDASVADKTSGVSMAPTKLLADKKTADELEMCKLKAGWQQEKIDELTKERDYLKEQLAAALKKDDTSSTSTLDTTSTRATRVSSHSSSDTSMESSSESTSDSSSDMSSSEDKKKGKQTQREPILRTRWWPGTKRSLSCSTKEGPCLLHSRVSV